MALVCSGSSDAASRMVFCTACDGITPAGERTCRGCGTDLVDVYATA